MLLLFRTLWEQPPVGIPITWTGSLTRQIVWTGGIVREITW